MTPQPFVDEVRECRQVQSVWQESTVQHRLRCVKRFRHLLVDAADELMAAVENDVARPPGEVIGSDVLPLAAAAKYLEQKAAAILAPRRVQSPPLYLIGQKDTVYRRPWGVVGIIGTWNYPLFLNGIQLLQALTAGNGVLWKPSEFGSRSAILIGKLLNGGGFPRGLVQLLPSDRAAGPRLVESDIDHLVFTGSASVGRKIAVRLAERMIPSTLELSGIDAMFVLDDADVELAARAAWFGFTLNRGQTCLGVRRVFVQQKVHDAFVGALRLQVENASLMPLVAQQQAEHAQLLIEDAAAKGATVLKPGQCHGWAAGHCAPHIILNAKSTMRLFQEECFAPLTGVLPFDSLDEALAMDSQCAFALGASIFTRDSNRAAQLAAQLRAGMVAVNDVIVPVMHPATPFGGRGASGWGTTQGAEGLLAMTTAQVVSQRRGKFRPHLAGTSPRLERLLRRMLALTHGRNPWQRFRGMLG